MYMHQFQCQCRMENRISKIEIDKTWSVLAPIGALLFFPHLLILFNATLPHLPLPSLLCMYACNNTLHHILLGVQTYGLLSNPTITFELCYYLSCVICSNPSRCCVDFVFTCVNSVSSGESCVNSLLKPSSEWRHVKQYQHQYCYWYSPLLT